MATAIENNPVAQGLAAPVSNQTPQNVMPATANVRPAPMQPAPSPPANLAALRPPQQAPQFSPYSLEGQAMARGQMAAPQQPMMPMQQPGVQQMPRFAPQQMGAPQMPYQPGPMQSMTAMRPPMPMQPQQQVPAMQARAPMPYAAPPTVAQAMNGPTPQQMQGAFMSDATKKVISKDSLADAFLESLHPYSYRYKDAGDEPRAAPTGGKYLGVMAQDLEAVPEIGPQLILNTPHGKMVDQRVALSATMAGVGRLYERVRALETDALKKKGGK